MSTVNFTLLRDKAVGFEYFKAFHRLKTLSGFGHRLNPNITGRSHGIERGLALHVHMTLDYLIAHQWAYNGLMSQAVCRDRLVALPLNRGDARLYNYYPSNESFEAAADENGQAIFQTCLDQTKTRLLKVGPGVLAELDKIQLTFSQLPTALTALDHDLGAQVAQVDMCFPIILNFKLPPLTFDILIKD
jgi:hypothetical protein